MERNQASDHTVRRQEAAKQEPGLDWGDARDWERARRGFVARLEDPVVRDERGRTVWDLTSYAFLDAEEAPTTVHPSLWRQARLNLEHGLYRIHERIYQVRGHDLSVVSFLVGEEGYVVIDPLISAECAHSALELVYEHVGRRPVTAVIYTHSHIDHYGGVEGVVSREDVAAGRVRILAPVGFTEAAVSENLIAGNAMTRRAMYMYGNLLPRDPRGQVDAGLGKTTSRGTVGLIEPTESIGATGEKKVVDGLEIVFQVTPDTEAPAEMNFFFPQMRALCMAENCSHNMHNLYTLRGAPVRDARAWAHYLDEAIALFADGSDLVFTSHHWPVWGRDELVEYLELQRDMYKFLHDQTLRLANHGLTPLEIAEGLELPPSLARPWYNRAYYGSVSHNSRAVYQRYLGFFDGHPARLAPLPPAEAGRRYVELAGGAEALLAHARDAYARGEYRWVAQVVDHLVFADPGNDEARQLEADALEQLGYQTESAPWRNFYLTGAQELRAWSAASGGRPGGAVGAGMLRGVGLDLLFDYLAVRFDGTAAEGRDLVVQLELMDTGETAELRVGNCVLHGYPGRRAERPDATLRLARRTLDGLAVGRVDLAEAIAAQHVAVAGDADAVVAFFAELDVFDRWFPIVTP